MNRVRKFCDSDGKHLGYTFECPGCGEMHAVYTDNAKPGANWQFNGSLERPTFSPSILVRGTQRQSDEEIDRIMKGEKIEPRPRVCHSFVTDGRIQFLGDCTHALAGQTVELPEVGE